MSEIKCEGIPLLTPCHSHEGLICSAILAYQASFFEGLAYVLSLVMPPSSSGLKTEADYNLTAKKKGRKRNVLRSDGSSGRGGGGNCYYTWNVKRLSVKRQDESEERKMGYGHVDGPEDG